MLARVLIVFALFGSFAPAAHAAADGKAPRDLLARTEAALHGRGDGRDVSALLKQVAVALPHLEGADRARAYRLLARPTPGEGRGNEDEYRVPEHSPPHCTTHFCIHWVDSTSDAPDLTDANGNGVPDYVDTMAGVFEEVYAFENDRLGWKPPKADGTRGCPGGADFCTNRTDVYIKDVGGEGIYGSAAPDPGQRTASQMAYLTMDDDYSAQQFARYGGNSLPPMQVTAAHEYNHVLQYNYDTAADTWMFESTATWMEDEVYTDVNDYLQYVNDWAQISPIPLTYFNANNGGDPLNSKAYGDAVWNRWLEAKFGPDVVRNAWELSRSTKPKSLAPLAFDAALRSRGSSFSAAFAQFAADTAEWRTASSPFAEGTSFRAVDRVPGISLRAGEPGAGGSIDHTGYYLIDVPATTVPRLKLVLEIRSGTSAALALVGREGDETTGTASSVVRRLKHGGTGTVVLENPGRFNRITAVVINSDVHQRGYSQLIGDWIWRGDNRRVQTRVSTDFTPPGFESRSPGANRRGVSTRTRVRATFNERLRNVTAGTVILRGPGNRKVKARVKSSGRKLTLTPRARLRAGRVYVVRLSSAIRDLGGNPLRSAARSWRFRTAG